MPTPGGPCLVHLSPYASDSLAFVHQSKWPLVDSLAHLANVLSKSNLPDAKNLNTHPKVYHIGTTACYLVAKT